MSVEHVSALLQETVTVALMVAAPFLIAALATGLFISIFQAATQINEQTLTFVPKIVAVLGTFAVLFPWIMGHIMQFSLRMFAQFGVAAGP